MSDYNKILLIQTAFLGDAILTTPLIRALKETYPNALLNVLCIPDTAAVFKNNPHINSILIFNKRKIIKRGFSFFRVLHKIRSNKYDLAVSCQLSLTTSLFMYLGRIDNRLGFPRQKLTTMTIKLEKGIPIAKRYLMLMNALTDKDFLAQTELFWDDITKQKVDNIYSENFSNKTIVVGIAPGSIWSTKRWLPEYYAKLIAGLSGFGIKTVLIGGKDDYELCERIVKLSGVNQVNLAGKLSILESAYLIKKLRLLVGNDSAPIHLANAVQTDVVAIFGPTVKEFGFAPFRLNDKIMELELNCRPCGKHGHQKCPLKHFYCMKNLLPEAVLKSVLETLEHS